MTANSDTPVQATETSCRVLDAVVETDGATLAALVHRLDHSKSSIHNHLRTLEQLGLLVRDGQTYRPSLRFLEIGTGARRQFALYQHGRTQAVKLSNVTGLSASLLVLEQERLACLFTATANNVEQPTVAAGDVLPLHCTAPGKAILSEQPRDVATELLPGAELPAYTENTITSTDELLAALDEIRSQGWAADREEWQRGVQSLAATVTDTGGHLHGALCVTGPPGTLSGKRFEQDIPGLLISSATDIQTTIGR